VLIVVGCTVLYHIVWAFVIIISNLIYENVPPVFTSIHLLHFIWI